MGTQHVPDDLLTTPVSALFFDRGFLWRYRATPLRVIDGDTFVALVDCGFFGRHEAHIRVADLNAPERGHPGYLAAQLALQNALPDRPHWPLRIISHQRETIVAEIRSFERYVATVLVVGADDSLVDVREML